MSDRASTHELSCLSFSTHPVLETQEEIPTKKRKEATKLTKHGFLDKIKSAAVAAGTDKTKNSEESGKVGGNEKGTAKWMKDDFMLNPKKVRIID